MNNAKAFMPAVFIGHGSPMNALVDNAFSRALAHLGAEIIPPPKAILVISAHWMTKGTWLTHMLKPRTIHDFYGFPEALFQVQYPAPGSPELAERVQDLLKGYDVQLDDSDWGLDHGTWSVLRHMYPNADIPIVQLSLDMSRPPAFHYELGTKLRSLRNEEILVLGSGNLVHNLSLLNWSDAAVPHSWATEQDEWFKAQILSANIEALVHDYDSTEAGRLSVPTPDHYYPFLYVLGAAAPSDKVHFDYEEIQLASISMRSVRFT